MLEGDQQGRKIMKQVLILRNVYMFVTNGRNFSTRPKQIFVEGLEDCISFRLTLIYLSKFYLLKSDT